MAKKALQDLKLDKLDDSLGLEPELALEPSGLSAKLSGFTSKLFGVIKFLIGLCFLPAVYACSAAFLTQLGAIDKVYRDYFWLGVITLVMVHLFIWEPQPIYARGHKLLEVVFNFFKPLVRVAPYLLPIYVLILFAVYGILSLSIKDAWLLYYTVFMLGFAISMHLVFSARAVRTKKNDFLKGNYIFGFSFIYIINLALLAFGLSMIFKEYSFVKFCNNSFHSTGSIFSAIFKQLFLR